MVISIGIPDFGVNHPYGVENRCRQGAFEADCVVRTYLFPFSSVNYEINF